MAENIFMSPHPASAQLGLNIIDVIPDSQDFVENMSEYGVGGGTPSEANCSAISSSVLSQNDPDIEMKKKAYVQIIEQPQAKALRFRYICEGRSAGSIPGVRSTPENKTYPTIKIMNYKGPAVVVVSCVTVDPPYRPHPHNLVGKEGCSKGVCTITIDNDSMECMFSNLGIQCVKKKDVEQALKLREEIRVDPFNTGFNHRNQPQSIDLNAVRLCFQVFLNSGTEGRFTFPLKAVVSDPIYDKKATSDLNICKLSDYTSCVSGGKEIILLCDKVTKEDIQIRFTEVKDGHIEWEAYGDFQASDVHKQVAISFKTPKYKDIQVDHSVKVFIQLQRPSDKSTSEPRPFEYLPMDTGRPFSSFKRLKNNYGLFNRILGLEAPVITGNEELLPHKSQFKSQTAQVAPIKGLPSGGKPFSTTNSEMAMKANPSLQRTQGRKSPGFPATPAGASQSVDDIKQRMIASIDKKKSEASGSQNVPPHQLGPSPLWSEDISVYSDAELLEEVLSEGSVNDLLSTMGDGLAVYEDLTPLPNQLELPTDAFYGDASYASCYSNLEFALGKNRIPVSSFTNSTTTTTLQGIPPPVLPPKKISADEQETDPEFAIYGTPSAIPIHPNKESLLRERGFLLGAGSSPKRDMDNTLYYSPVSDILEVEEELENQGKEMSTEEIPQTILDLFV